MVFRDVIRVICCSLKMKEIPISKRISLLFISRSKHVQYVSFSPWRANSAWLSFDREKSILYEPTPSVFPVDHYSSPPQTADVTHDHLANPRCEALSDLFPALPAYVQAQLSEARSQFGSFPACNISAGAAFLWGWPGSNGRDFPNRGTEMGGLTHPLICYML